MFRLNLQPSSGESEKIIRKKRVSYSGVFEPTLRTERKLNKKLANLKRDNKISDSLYNKLRSSDGLPPRFYGLPKIHKPGYPLRPIVSFIDSPTYMLSKHLAQILRPLMNNTDLTVKNSVEFCEQMKNVKLEEGDKLLSFDVYSCGSRHSGCHRCAL